MYSLIHNSYVNGKGKDFTNILSYCGLIIVEYLHCIKTVTHTGSHAKAKILNDYFCSVFSKDDGSQTPNFTYDCFPNIPPIEINIFGIRKILQDLDPSKATGLDHIPA